MIDLGIPRTLVCVSHRCVLRILFDMPRYKLTIAYDGTDFCGWQRQEPPDAEAAREGATEDRPTIAAYSPDTPRIESQRPGRVALRTVQGVVESAVRQVVREHVEVLGASRTDSGVHARGQVAAFSCEPRDLSPDAEALKGIGWPLSRGGERLMLAINSRLPEDVVVTRAEAVGVGFDPVGDVESKGYSYTFHVSRVRPVRERRFVHHVWNPGGLNVAAMQAGAERLIGEHDFAAFAAAGHGRLSTVRTIYALSVQESPTGEPGDPTARRVVINVSGNGFLWNMVRIISGTLMQVGIGQRAADDIARVLASKDRTQAGPTIGPEGLCLEWIKYKGNG